MLVLDEVDVYICMYNTVLANLPAAVLETTSILPAIQSTRCFFCSLSTSPLHPLSRPPLMLTNAPKFIHLIHNYYQLHTYIHTYIRAHPPTNGIVFTKLVPSWALTPTLTGLHLLLFSSFNQFTPSCLSLISS